MSAFAFNKGSGQSSQPMLSVVDHMLAFSSEDEDTIDCWVIPNVSSSSLHCWQKNSQWPCQKLASTCRREASKCSPLSSSISLLYLSTMC